MATKEDLLREIDIVTNCSAKYNMHEVSIGDIIAQHRTAASVIRYFFIVLACIFS